MATKAELEAEVEALKRSNSALKGQITRLSNQAEEDGEASARRDEDHEAATLAAEGLSDHERAAVARLLDAIKAKGLANQIGNKAEVDDVRALLTK